jgi:NADPH:quinone reductase-like Zn-dependent oxidoreductase
MGGEKMTAAAIQQPTSMRAIVHERYGRPEVLHFDDIDRPELADDAVLVRVRAAALNKLDWYEINGTPLLVRPMMGGLLKPKSNLVGHDFAGTVEAVGKDVVDLQPGDDVFGAAAGSCAEYVRAGTGRVAPKPGNLSFEEAAAVPIAGLTALQGLRDRAGLEPGQTVLVNGASCGVGTFAVQIAKSLGAEVTAVCSTRNVEQARTLGADHVVDYTREDVSRSGRRFDVVFHVGGRMSWSQCKRVLGAKGKLVLAGASGNRFTGPLGYIGRIKLASWPSSHDAVFFVAKFNRPDLDVLRDLLESGRVKPVVETVYELAEVADAFRYLGEGHARGKLVVRL